MSVANTRENSACGYIRSTTNLQDPHPGVERQGIDNFRESGRNLLWHDCDRLS